MRHCNNNNARQSHHFLHNVLMLVSLATSAFFSAFGVMSPDEIVTCVYELDCVGFVISSSGVSPMPQACAEVVYAYV